MKILRPKIRYSSSLSIPVVLLPVNGSRIHAPPRVDAKIIRDNTDRVSGRMFAT